MKRINEYFIGGCVAFTVVNLLLTIIHKLNDQRTFEVNSEFFIFFVILLINSVLYFMENLQIKSQIIHIIFEYILISIATFGIGIPTKIIKVNLIYSVGIVLAIITIAYGITLLSLYVNGKNEANDINRKLNEMHK